MLSIQKLFFFTVNILFIFAYDHQINNKDYNRENFDQILDDYQDSDNHLISKKQSRYLIPERQTQNFKLSKDQYLFSKEHIQLLLRGLQKLSQQEKKPNEQFSKNKKNRMTRDDFFDDELMSSILYLGKRNLNNRN